VKIVEGAIGPHVAGDAEHIARNIVALLAIGGLIRTEKKAA